MGAHVKVGERIRLITECAESLLDSNEAVAQLVLRQFGAETFDFNEGFAAIPENEYFVSRCESLDDDGPAAMHEYLLGDDAAPSGPNQSTHGVWGTSPIRVFISHRHEDAVFASGVNDLLRSSFGIDAFVAHRDIVASAAWRATIRGALASCHFLVAILHENFHGSQWCDQEVGWALGRDIPVMPVRRTPHPQDQTRVDGFLEEHQDLVLDSKRGTGEWFLAEQIFERVVKDPRTQNAAVGSLVEAFVNSGSYDRTRRTWTLIENVASFTTDQLRRLEYAVATNNQVYDCYCAGDNQREGTPIPDRVKALVRHFEPGDPWSISPTEQVPQF